MRKMVILFFCLFLNSFATATSSDLVAFEATREPAIAAKYQSCMTAASGKDPELELCLATRANDADTLLTDVIQQITNTYKKNHGTDVYNQQFLRRLHATMKSWTSFVDMECGLLSVDGYGGTSEEQDRFDCKSNESLQRARNLAKYFNLLK